MIPSWLRGTHCSMLDFLYEHLHDVKYCESIEPEIKSNYSLKLITSMTEPQTPIHPLMIGAMSINALKLIAEFFGKYLQSLY